MKRLQQGGRNLGARAAPGELRGVHPRLHLVPHLEAEGGPIHQSQPDLPEQWPEAVLQIHQQELLQGCPQGPRGGKGAGGQEQPAGYQRPEVQEERAPCRAWSSTRSYTWPSLTSGSSCTRAPSRAAPQWTAFRTRAPRSQTAWSRGWRTQRPRRPWPRSQVGALLGQLVVWAWMGSWPHIHPLVQQVLAPCRWPRPRGWP